MIRSIADLTGIDPARLRELDEHENARFVAERPRSMANTERARRTMPRGVPMSWMDDLYEHPPVWASQGTDARFTDVDGHEYLDLYIADMSAFCGHGARPVVEAVAARIGAGNQFLLAGEDAIVVAEHLVSRYGMPKWQFTLSATQANTEVIRLARHATGREVVVVFDGKYHGHGDATLVTLDDGTVVREYDGLPASVAGQARIVPFNDPDAVARALAPLDVAVVLTEPAMTNAGFILPEPGFHEALRRLTREAGTLLAIDETHTLVCAYGGLAREFGLKPDVLVVGKSIAAGVPLGAYGMTDDVAALIHQPDVSYVVSGSVAGEVATGGTLFANALSMSAGRAALVEVLTPDAFQRTGTIGARMADGLRAAIAAAGLRWCVAQYGAQYGAHGCSFFAPTPPRNGAESRDADDPTLRALTRVYLANRGIWESGWWLGPTVSVAHTAADVDEYVARFRDLLADLTAPPGG